MTAFEEGLPAPKITGEQAKGLIDALNKLSGESEKAKGSVPETPVVTGVSDDVTYNPAQIPDTTPTEAVGKSSKTRENYTEKDEDSTLGTHARRQSGIDESYTDNPEEWDRRYRYWDWNLAKDNPRGNLNGMAFKDTRLMSRLADALNNERHLKPTDIGRRTLHMGATGTGADNAGSERWEPIETQEMRQMRANERLDEKARDNYIDRQKKIEDYPMELREKMDDANRELSTYASQTGIDLERFMQKGIFNAEYQQSWQSYWNTLQQKFTQELGLDISERIFAKLARIKSYPLQQMYGLYQKGINVPNPLLSSMWDATMDLYNKSRAAGDPPAVSAGILQAAWGIMAQTTGMNAMNTFTGWMGR